MLDPSIRKWLVVFACLGAAGAAQAAPKHFRVGAGCTYATIQAALDAERAGPGTPADFIWVARNQDYAAQDLQIHDQNVFVYGGVDDCVDTSVAGTTTLSGAGGAAKSVMTISGRSQVWLGGLTITQGDNGDNGVGGGINFNGTGSLTIASTTITNNHAGYGGGIQFHGTGNADDFARLTIQAETLITHNTATTSGGGIRVEGNALLRITAGQVLIALNHADGGYGGGIMVLAPAKADLGSPGYDGVALLYENTAQYGGGISVNSGGSHQDALVRLFATDALHPVAIEGNVASSAGGGLHSAAGVDVGEAWVCGTGYRIAHNSAKEGGVLYGAGLGADFLLSRVYADYCLQGDAAALGATTCTAPDCNTIEGNLIPDVAGQPMTGSTFALHDSGYLVLDATRAVGNRGAHLLRLEGAGAEARFMNTLFDGNAVTDDFMSAALQTYLHVVGSTFADNTIGGTAVVVRSAGALDLFNDIFAEGGARTTLLYTGGNPAQYLHVDHVMSMEIASLAQGSQVIQADPLFVDAAHGDYRLQPASPAIDLAPAITGDDFDLGGGPRDVDIAMTPNLDGVRDLGAYERQIGACYTSDTVYCDGFDP